MRVFILEQCNVDVTPAEEYGEIVYVFSGTRPSIWSVGFSEAFVAKLRELAFDANKDCFLVAGPQVNATMALAALIKEYSSPRLLLWNAVKKHYTIWSIPHAA